MDGKTKFFDFVERFCKRASVAIEAATGEEKTGGERERATETVFSSPGESSYLESSGKDCGTSQVEQRLEIACIGCRSWFCPHCCTARGLNLRRRLMRVLHTFKGLTMWTLTLDPTLFASPIEAYRYVREHRCISEFMRRLKQSGHLLSGRYFYVIEWQKNTEMVHYHVLAESGFVPFDLVCKIWNGFRPRSAGPVQGERPAFGSVRFTRGELENARQAANYACAYLIKFPEHGYPAWVLDDVSGEIHRYSTSRGFWGESGSDTANDEDGELFDDAGADESADEADAVDADQQKPPTIRQRVARCGEKTLLVRVVENVDLATGEIIVSRVPLLVVNATVSQLATAIRVDPAGKRRVPVTADHVPEFRRAFDCRSIIRADRDRQVPVLHGRKSEKPPVRGEGSGTWAMIAGR